MNVLITGVSGFVGSRLAQRLGASGDYVIFGTGRGSSVASDLNEILQEYYQSNLLDVDQCEQMLQGVDVVVHCAAKAGAWGAYQEFAQANVQATSVLLRAAKKAGVRRFINISSPSIYFQYKDQLGLLESDRPVKFSNAYAETKYMAEILVQQAHHSVFLTLSLRPRGIIGAGDRNWLPRIFSMAESNSLVKPSGKNNLVDFTSVSNLIDAIMLCFEVEATSFGRVYNISNDKPENLWDVVHYALDKAEVQSEVKTVAYPIAMLVATINEKWAKMLNRKDEPSILPIKVGVASFSMTLDISLAKQKLGYHPKQTTYDAVDEFIEQNF